MGGIKDILASLLFNLKSLFPFSSLSTSTMARRQARNARRYRCTLKQCDERFTRRSDVKRHAKIHLLGESLEEQKHPCLITETGCDKSMLQLSNLKSHIKAKHPDVLHLVCFDCRPEFQRFHDTAALADHIQVEHPPNLKQTRQTKRRRKMSKRSLSPTLPPIVSLSDDNSDVFPPPPAGRFPLPPLDPPPRKPRVKLPDCISIPPSAFPKDEPEPPCSPSHRRTQWYRAPQPQSQLQPEDLAPTRRCHLTIRNPSTLHKKARDACVFEHARQLPSPAPSSSGAGESSRSSLGRFPLPPPPPPTSRLITPAFVFNKLPSPSSSRAPSPTFEIPFSSSKGGAEGLSEGAIDSIFPEVEAVKM
ncbi:hypothetical protein ARMGADRAFT_1099089 [Armillaria gallica]|uniref:C2H2-type domain-containing protein n=1 Tax=Armillaria gallica TaxID=47427 RepID=A0A2H3DSD9_ARMGA|nr:hypothetical protein ARMGADRAFT_1099089 [Armillaria gallica]